MSRNSTLKLWDLFLKEQSSSFDKSPHRIPPVIHLEPYDFNTVILILKDKLLRMHIQ